MVTLKRLKKEANSPTWHDFFDRHFPDGATSWVDVAKHPECPDYLRAHIAINVPSISVKDRISIAKMCYSTDYVLGRLAVDNLRLSFNDLLNVIDACEDKTKVASFVVLHRIELSVDDRINIAEMYHCPPAVYGEMAERLNDIPFDVMKSLIQKSGEAGLFTAGIIFSNSRLTNEQRAELLRMCPSPLAVAREVLETLDGEAEIIKVFRNWENLEEFLVSAVRAEADPKDLRLRGNVGDAQDD